MRFSDVHSASSVCSPDAVRHPDRPLCLADADEKRRPARIFAGADRAGTADASLRCCKQAGYVTAGFGKWHLGFQEFDPGQKRAGTARRLRAGRCGRARSTIGFDEFFGIPASLDMPPYVFVDKRPSRRDADGDDRRQRRHANTPAALSGGPARSLLRFIMPTFCRGSPSGPSRSWTARRNRRAMQALLPVFRPHGAAHSLFAGPQFPRTKRGGRLRRLREHGRRIGRRSARRRLDRNRLSRSNTPHHDQRQRGPLDAGRNPPVRPPLESQQPRAEVGHF